MDRRTLFIAGALAGLLLVLANGLAFAFLRQANQTPNESVEATTVPTVQELVTTPSLPSMGNVFPTSNPSSDQTVPTPSLPASHAVQIVLQRAPEVKLVGEPILVKTDQGLAWQVLTDSGVLLVHAETGSILYDGRPIQRIVTRPGDRAGGLQTSTVADIPHTSGLVLAPSTDSTGSVAPAPSMAPNVPPSLPSSGNIPQPTVPTALTPDDATAIARAWVPGSRIVSGPELVIFEGTPAYEVVLDAGVLYIDANTGSIIYDGTVTASPGHTGDEKDHDDENDRGEKKEKKHKEKKHDEDHDEKDHDEDDDD